MQVIPLGAGQDVGRSCIIVSFAYLSKTGRFDKVIDCIIISHFHLDHCGALPYFSEVLGYSGPIYMTHPTRAVIPILLEDYRKISVEKFRDKKNFTRQDIESCMKKVKTIHMMEEFMHDDDFLIKPFYAGHVLGAAMFYVKVGNRSVVYTGDFNTTADKHLGSAWIDRLEPDLLITESTYGSIIRDCRKSKERRFLNCVYECVSRGGKVLIPIFALGRAQELCILIDSYWERMNLNIPIYSSSGLTEKANSIYKLFINYTNEAIREKALKMNAFEFKHIKSFQTSFVYDEGPMVLFASPGMLHSGVSLSVFKKWCSDEKNLIIIPGYCVSGTVGEKILNGAKSVEINGVSYDVNMKVENLAFSAHADAQGILQIVEQCKPKNVLLVHGEKQRMKALKRRIEKELHVPTFYPRNGTMIGIRDSNTVSVDVSRSLLKKVFCLSSSFQEDLSLRLYMSMEGRGKKAAVADIEDLHMQEED
ncbi:UNVERIFIED_CONTAM: hypothetical protein PYX00_011280 [Menopon gallinae]|uniref:Integrator complex subunit 11 n=1 Tax=Menopon gallinae TaxID=328185 RepID=A0AAW2H750_9NEOP